MRASASIVLSAAFSSCAFVASCTTASTPPLAPGMPLAPPSDLQPLPAAGTTPPVAEDAVDWCARFASVGEAVGDAITEGKIPGCVVAIGRHDGVLFERAYGSRALDPERDADDGRHGVRSRVAHQADRDRDEHHDPRRAGLVSLDAPASTYVPEFARLGKGAITRAPAPHAHRAASRRRRRSPSFDHGRARRDARTSTTSLPQARPARSSSTATSASSSSRRSCAA